MIINKITLDNYGVFYGKHEFLLEPDTKTSQRKPIILFGGMNGAGKTTIFDAFKLCIYGDDYINTRENGAYKKFLKNKIHHSKDLLIQPNYASVETEFQYSKGGVVSAYCVKRQWEETNGVLREFLKVQRNGMELSEIETENWQEFINDLLPKGLSQLFFFDGEKIQKMVSDENNSDFKKSIKSLIGLEILERLKADLKIYRSHYLKQRSNEQLKDELDQLINEIEFIQSQKSICEDKRAKLKNSRERTQNEINEYEKKIKAQGGDFLAKRDLLKEEKIKIENEIENLKEKIRELCSGLLPIAIAKNCSLNLKRQILKEKKTHQHMMATDILREKKRELIEGIEGTHFYRKIKVSNADDRDQIISCVMDEISKVFPNSLDKTNGELTHHFSEMQGSQMLTDLEYGIHQVPDLIKNGTKDYEKKYRNLQNLHKDLQKIPDEELIRPMYEKLNKLYKDLGAQEGEQKNMVEELNQLGLQLNDVERKKEKAEGFISENIKTDKKLKLSQKIEKIITTFNAQLAELKCQKLTKEFTSIFNSIHRKKHMIHKILIDPKTFDILLIDRNERKISKDNLSSGELELFAISMVWALAKVSGQKFPFIIDTPLGRLDSKHRDNLLRTFFPHASHQMIIFSTDTEIDKKYFDVIKNSVSRTYLLEHKDNERKTIVKKGYFWN